MSDLSKRFHSLKGKWEEETWHMSSTTNMMRNPSYKEIVAMGKDVVPLMLEDLVNSPAFWFEALRELTGASPDKHLWYTGKIQEMADCWVDWGRANGYLPAHGERL